MKADTGRLGTGSHKSRYREVRDAMGSHKSRYRDVRDGVS